MACKTWSIAQSTYRLDELGWLQFEQLCDELLAEHGLTGLAWNGRADNIRETVVGRVPHSLTGTAVTGRP